MEEPSRCLIFDPFSGISGDMTLGALVDLDGASDWLRDTVRALPLNVDISISTVTRGALKASFVKVEPQDHEPPRRLQDVLQIVAASDIDATARDTAAAAFRLLADVEGEIHGLPADDVHFHEVGGADSIVDIIAAAAGVARLGVEACLTRPVALGRGWTNSAHGNLPLPAPATLKLLEGLPAFESDVEGELTTPTGAALLKVLTAGKRSTTPFVPLRSGFGAGARDPSSHPNCLRLVLAEIDQRGSMLILQADIDDMSPEYLPPLREALGAAGATDVWTYSVQMKKARTGLRVEALVPTNLREAVSGALFRNSTTLGLRFWPVDREVLPRAANQIEWRGFPIRVKSTRSVDGHVIYKPEYDDVVQAARAVGIPPLIARQEIEKLLLEDRKG
jgi:uncharacterized protein (TIGR00299 family) protein